MTNDDTRERHTGTIVRAFLQNKRMEQTNKSERQQKLREVAREIGEFMLENEARSVRS